MKNFDRNFFALRLTKQTNRRAVLVKSLSQNLTLGVTLLLVTPKLAAADIAVRFIESAPKDSFRFENLGSCAITQEILALDLSKSAAGLIFDTEPTGRGVEVFQPLEVTQGADFLVEAPVTQDGASKTELVVSELPPSGAIRLTVDVDDTLTASDLGQIRVSGSEIVGAEVRLGEIIAVFDETGRALLTVACETA